MDRYRLIDAEDDAMGIVMKATDQQTGQPVTIHKITHHGQLKQKMMMLTQYDDLKILDYFENTQFLYVVLESAEPLSLMATLSEIQVLEILLQLLQLFGREGNPGHPLFFKNGMVKIYRLAAIDCHPLYTPPEKRHRILKNLKKSDEQIVWQLGVRTFQYLTGQKYKNDYESSYREMVDEIELRVRSQDHHWEIFGLLRNMLKFTVQDRINCKMVQYSLRLLKSKYQKNQQKSIFHSQYEKTTLSETKKFNYSRSFKESSKVQFPKYKKRLHMNLFNCVPQTPKSIYSTWTRASPMSSFSNSTDMFKRLREYEEKKFKKQIEHLEKLKMPRKGRPAQSKRSSSRTFRSKVKSSTPREVKVTPRQAKVTPREVRITPREAKVVPCDQPVRPKQCQVSKLSTKQSTKVQIKMKPTQQYLEQIDLERQPMREIGNLKEVKVTKDSIELVRNVKREETSKQHKLQNNKIQLKPSNDQAENTVATKTPSKVEQLMVEAAIAKPSAKEQVDSLKKQAAKIQRQPAILQRMTQPPKLQQTTASKLEIRQPLIKEQPKTLQISEQRQEQHDDSPEQLPIQKAHVRHQCTVPPNIRESPAPELQLPPPSMKIEQIQQSEIEPKDILRIYNILGETVKHANLNMKQQRNIWFIPSFFIYKCYLCLRKRFIESFRENLQPKVIEQIQKQNTNIQTGIQKMHKSIQPPMLKQFSNHQIVNADPLTEGYKKELVPVLQTHFKTVESTVSKSKNTNIDPVKLKDYMKYVCLIGCSIIVIDQNYMKNRVNVKDLLEAANKKIGEGKDWQSVIQEIVFKVHKISY